MGSHLKPIEANKKTMTAIVQDRIREAIMEGVLIPGSRIDQIELAEKLDVSLVPIREALKKLEAEGFVKILPRRGAFVTNTSIADMEDLYRSREILEGETAALAASQLTEADLKTLHNLLPQMEHALAAQHIDAFMQQNRDFHFTIYRAAGSTYLLNMITSLWELAERYRYRYMFIRDQGKAISGEHQTIYTACTEHDSDKLRTAIIYHMRHTLEGIKVYLQTSPHPHIKDSTDA
jgi:DNA-binding GntR family transcriptional regulator